MAAVEEVVPAGSEIISTANITILFYLFYLFYVFVFVHLFANIIEL